MEFEKVEEEESLKKEYELKILNSETDYGKLMDIVMDFYEQLYHINASEQESSTRKR